MGMKILTLIPTQMEKDILVPLQQEEQDLWHPRQEHTIIIEKNLEKFHRKIIQMVENGWYPRWGDYSLVMERRNADLPTDDE